MLSDTHGICIDIEKCDGRCLLSVKAKGKLTHEDYQYMSPMLDSALEQVHGGQVNVLVDMSEFTGWELRAAWDDFKLGLKHGSEFNKIALWGKSSMGDLSAKIAGWFTRGEVKYFHDQNQATEWLIG